MLTLLHNEANYDTVNNLIETTHFLNKSTALIFSSIVQASWFIVYGIYGGLNKCLQSIVEESSFGCMLRVRVANALRRQTSGSTT